MLQYRTLEMRGYRLIGMGTMGLTHVPYGMLLPVVV